MKKRNGLIYSALILVVIICVLSGVYISVISKDNTDTSTREEIPLNNVVEVVEDSKADKFFTKERWANNHNINNDYIGQLIFESEIINEPIVQDSRDSYLRKNWITNEYDIQGTCYMDSRNSLDDDNLIIYGHYSEVDFKDYKDYDPDKRPMFSNLELLLDSENYEENKTVYLYLENEVREYEVVMVYYCPLDKDDNTGEYVYVRDGYEYYYTDYNNDEFNHYMNTIEPIKQYNTDLEVGLDDKLLTLQTCVSKRPDLREIVICKEVDIREYK